MFPSIISTFPQVSATDRLNNPSHSALHNSISSVLTQVQTVIGVEGANSVVGSLEYLIKSPDSNGGGHIQSANKGGTGQTTYTKGDLLVATSTSVLTKLAVSSTTGESLQIDPTTATGMKWAAQAGANKVAINTSSIIVASALGVPIPLFSTSILGSTLGTNNGIKFGGVIQRAYMSDSQNWQYILRYGGNVVASINTANAALSSVLQGNISGALVGNGGVSSQLGYLTVDLRTPHSAANPTTIGQTVYVNTYSTSSVESSADQNLSIEVLVGPNPTTAHSVLTGVFIVEKIS